MKPNLHIATLVAGLLGAGLVPVSAADVSLETAPPVVVRTQPVAGSADVDPALSELRVTFSKPMQDGSWSWSTWGKDTFPELAGKPRYLPDGRTCVVSVKLQPGKFYATWLNSERFQNFKDRDNRPAVPYLLTFRTRFGAAAEAGAEARVQDQAAAGNTASTPAEPAPTAVSPLLNDNQKLVVKWTDNRFRSFFDQRAFDDWSSGERAELEKRSIENLKGPRSPEYYQAINTLGALRSSKALPQLREIAYDRREKDNRDRWMAIRVIGMIGSQEDVPELIPLVYHGNSNTRWWAQISLVGLTGKNFGSDWEAWGNWWNQTGKQPAYKPDTIKWWNGQPDPEKLPAWLDEADQKFLAGIGK